MAVAHGLRLARRLHFDRAAEAPSGVCHGSLPSWFLLRSREGVEAAGKSKLVERHTNALGHGSLKQACAFLKKKNQETAADLAWLCPARPKP
jgi:hypothetical protein